MAAIATEPDFDLAAFRRHVYTNLPSYARPVVIRLCTSIERTGTFKLSAGRLAAEAYSGAPLDQLWFDGPTAQAYIPCTDDLLLDIERGVLPT